MDKLLFDFEESLNDYYSFTFIENKIITIEKILEYLNNNHQNHLNNLPKCKEFFENLANWDTELEQNNFHNVLIVER